MLRSSFALATLLLLSSEATAKINTEHAKAKSAFLKSMRSTPAALSHQRTVKKRQLQAASIGAASATSTPSFEEAVMKKKPAGGAGMMGGDFNQLDANLRKKIIERATYVSPEEVKERQRKERANKKNRQLANDDAAANNNANNNAYSDDYFYAAQFEGEYGFDVTQYSISYLRCATVRQFDEEIASQQDTDRVFSTKEFAVFRFCPASNCDGYDRDNKFEYECDENDDAVECCDEDNDDYDQCVENQMYEQYWKNGKNNQNNQKNSAYNQAYGNRYNNQDKYAAYNCDGDNCEEEEEEEIWGANGEGCQENYGEYMLELETYLMIMQEYREERFEVYCDYCMNCLQKVYQSWMNSQGRSLEEVDFDSDEWMKELDTIPQDEINRRRQLGGCPEWDTCKLANNLCGNDMEDDYSDYFECVEVERNNGMVAYIGPHCKAAEVEGELPIITLGVYADENCDEYIGNGVDIRNWIGEDLDEDALIEYYNPEDYPCIPCRAADQLYEGSTYQYGDVEENWGEDEITTLCEAVYQNSARCDKHYKSYSNKQKYAKYYNAQHMDLSCDFIESVVADNYDEMGYVRLNSTADSDEPLQRNFLTDSIYYQEYGAPFVETVTPLQVFGLCASILACGILALWSCALHKSVSKKAPWRPRRGASSSVQPVDVTRQNSGIMMGRSRSNM